jgi:acyl transferase domain-containing protein/NADPH:quinone reductase-like Zn-dependent oxidoreductase
LDEALRNGDTIRGVIRNTGTNQDGKTNGITLPSSEAQENLIRRVYKEAGLEPAKTSYVETHGTGTPAGDPLEAGALARVFGPGRPASQPLLVGSVKTNIGHLEGASGLAGLIKTVLMLENNMILPNVNFEKANPSIPLSEWKLKVPTAVEPWPTTEVRRASICNYGYGGSNSHVVIDEAHGYLAQRGLKGAFRITPSIASKPLLSLPKRQRARIFVLSAFDETSGKTQAKNLALFLKEQQHSKNHNLLKDLAFTLGQRRSILPYKAAVSATSVPRLIDALESDDLKYSKANKPPSIGFVFTGQGAQWHAMGRELNAEYHVFRNSLLVADKVLRCLGASWSLLAELSKTAEESLIGQGHLSQPLCTAIQVALVDLLASWGVLPTSVTGHSSGEVAAAYAAGALSRESALAVAYCRGLAAPAIKRMYPHRKGSMMAVGLSKRETQAWIENLTSGKVVVACINSPSSVTVSGDDSAISELLDLLKAQKIFARKLSVELAYHSHHMDCVGNDYLEALQRIRPQDYQRARFYSSVTGRQLEFSELGPSYWVINMLKPVEFSDALRSLCLDVSEERREQGKRSGVDILIELGPHSALAGPIKQILQADPTLRTSSIRYFSALTRDKSAVDTALELACQLFKCGYPVDFSSINNPCGDSGHRVLVDLPPYPWNHSQSYSAESRESRNYRSRSSPRSDILGAPVRDSLPLEPRWRNYIRPAEIPWVRDHRIQSNTVYPAGGFVAMAIEAACQSTKLLQSEISGYKLRDITISSALVIPDDDEEVETMVCLSPYSEFSGSSSGTWQQFKIYSVTGAHNWTEHCRGLIMVQKEVPMNEIDGQRSLTEEREDRIGMIADAEAICSQDVDIKQLYMDLKMAGLHYGPSFAMLKSARAAPYQSIVTLSVHDTAAMMPSGFQYPCVVHPSTLDSCFQALFPGVAAADRGIKHAAMPTSIEEMFVSSKTPQEPNHLFEAFAKSEKTGPRQLSCTITVFDAQDTDQTPMITVKGLVCSSIPKASTDNVSEQPRKLCFKTNWIADPDFLTTDQLNEMCRTRSFSGKYGKLQAYIDIIANKNPYLKCLEIGASSDTIASSLLPVLGSSDSSNVPRCTSYEILHSNTEVLEELKDKLKAWNDIVSFKKIESEIDLLKQGLERQSYDIIIFSNDLKGLAPFYNLLKPTGRLLALESILDLEPSTLGLELCFSTAPPEVDDRVALTVLKPNNSNTISHFEVAIVTDEISSPHSIEHLEGLLSNLGASVSITTLTEAATRGKFCIFLGDFTRSILEHPSITQFESIKRILSESNGVLWVSQGATIDSASPTSNLISGLVRTVNLESTVTTVTLDLDTQVVLEPEACAQVIVDVFWKSFDPNRNGEVVEHEYAERAGLIMIPRIIEDTGLTSFVSSKTSGDVTEDQPFYQPGRPFRVEFGVPGQLDSIRFTDDIRMESPLPNDYVQIDVRATSIDARDAAVAMGRSKPSLIGTECSGVITAVGSDVTELQVGDRITCYAQGTICNIIRQHATMVQVLPDNINFELGASIPVAYTTAFYSLFKLASLEPNDTVLIHSAASALAQAHVRFCQSVGSVIFATVSSLHEKEFVIKELNIPESNIFSTQDGAFKAAIMRRTRNKGVDVIINLSSGETFRQTLECIAPFGRFIELGADNHSANTRLQMNSLFKNVTFASVDINELISQRPQQMAVLFAQVMSFIRDGTLCPTQPISSFGISEIHTAIRTVLTGKQMGPVVIKPEPNEMVNVVRQDKPNVLFRDDASYLLIGGLGGLGRAMASWMVNCGAKNLIFASRSGLAKQSARDLVKDLEVKGARVAVFECDVGNVEQLDCVLTQGAKMMPPIRGVIQSAMVMRNSFFQNMTLEDYSASLAPKVQGTWNLHNCLPKDTLDFFIMLSSAVGIIGNASQAAYAAASTFQDAFASYRTNLGLPAVSLDLGMIDDVGYVAENKSVQQSLHKLGFEGVKEVELMAMLQDAIERPLRTDKPAYTISGLGTYRPGDVRPALENPRFSHFRRLGAHLSLSSQSLSGTSSPANTFQAALRAASTLEEAAGIICDAVIEKLAVLLMIPVDDISRSKSMAEQGLDSLVAVQMKTWIGQTVEAAVSILELLSHISVKEFSVELMKRSKLVAIAT